MSAPVKITRMDHTASALRGFAAKSPDSGQVRRLLALALILDGHRRAEAAALAGMDRRTLRDWVHRYNADGVPGLRAVRTGGHPAGLNDDQMAELKALVLKGPDPAKNNVVRGRCVDNRHDSVHLFGAICPARGVGAAIIMPAVNTEAMNEYLQEISAQVSAGAIALLILDGAGWHQTGGALSVPDNIALLHLPPYAPELNPMEKFWAYLRTNKLCNLVWNTYDDIVQACAKAWKFLIDDPHRIQ